MNTLLDFVQQLSFVRVGGSAEEKRAAALIMREIAASCTQTGHPAVKEPELMPFTIPSGRVRDCAVRALGRELPCAPFLRSGNIDRTLRLLYLDQGSEIAFAQVGELSDTAVLLNELTDEDTYKRLVEHHAAAFLIPKGKYYFTAEECSLYERALRDHFTRNGIIPGFTITAADATALIQENADSVYVKLQQEDIEEESQNVLAAIEGSSFPGQSVVLTAHYDSVPLGTGSWDNATGATALLAIHRYFAAHPPKRTMRFIWCGSEELGLLGSRAYIKQHEELLDSVKFCFNFDMCGTALGPNQIFVTGDKDLETYTEQYCKKAGYSAKLKAVVHSSDSAPFCDHDIPALGLSRGTSTSEIHTIHDLIPPLNEAAFQRNVDFAIQIISDITNAVVIPFEKKMSEERKKDLDKYFHRKEKEQG